jgi:phosphopantetheine--protein transferase-like protein
MVKGIGVDVVDISRIDEIIGKYGEHFLNKVFTRAEILYCGVMARPALHYAGRWAVKEAFYKALPPPCQEKSFFKSIEIIAAGTRKPEIRVCDSHLSDSLREHGITSMHMSISHEKAVCVAVVVLE